MPDAGKKHPTSILVPALNPASCIVNPFVWILPIMPPIPVVSTSLRDPYLS
jgi:hypothetical protein